jgi:hypothetical protein
MKVIRKTIRRTVTWGVTTLPLKKEPRPEIEVTVKATRFGIGYLDRRKLG